MRIIFTVLVNKKKDRLFSQVKEITHNTKENLIKEPISHLHKFEKTNSN